MNYLFIYSRKKIWNSKRKKKEISKKETKARGRAGCAKAREDKRGPSERFLRPRLLGYSGKNGLVGSAQNAGEIIF